MASETDWLERADWNHRSSEFGMLRQHRDRHGESFVAMQFVPPGASDAAVSERLWQLWLELPMHPHVLEAVGLDQRGQPLLRFAALDWNHGALKIDDPASAARVATWGIELTRVCGFLFVCIPEAELGWFACPMVKFDLEGEIRIAFLTAGGSTALANRLPPEVVDQWPRCDQRGLVFVVGQLLLGLVELDKKTSKTPLGQIMQRCLAKDPSHRFASVKELREALAIAGGRRNAVEGVSQPEVWDRLEAGIGYLAIGQTTKALQRFEAACKRDPTSVRARTCRAEAQRRGGELVLPAFSVRSSFGPPPKPDRPLVWADVASTARQLESERNFREALAVYEAIRFEGADLVALETSTARCHFRLGNSGHAIDYARRALARAPGNEEALEIRVNALLQRKQYAEAFECSDEWLAAAPAEGLAHHARGKSLIGLGRLVEARATFDRACSLSPQLLGAMLLRREVDRALKKVRATVGADAPQKLELPEHLADLRDLLVSGRIPDAIQMLRRADYERDAVAQLLLAELLAFDGHCDEALAVYESVGQLGDEYGPAALVGTAWALLDLGRAADALLAFDRVPDDLAAVEGRVQALQLLGRTAEADAAARHGARATGDRSELRVRSIRRRHW